MIEIKHVTDADDARDNGFYWYDTESGADLFGPFSSQANAEHAADYDIEDERTLQYFDADTRDFKLMRLRTHLSGFSTADENAARRSAVTHPEPGALCSRGGTIRGLRQCTRRCRQCMVIQGGERPNGTVLPRIAFYCADCGSFNVRVRHQTQVGGDEQRWYHPNRGWDGFSCRPDKEALDGQCRDCNGTDWDCIKEGNDWWKDFRQWFTGRSNY